MKSRDSLILRGPAVEWVTKDPLPVYIMQKLRESGDTAFLIHAETNRELSFVQVLELSTRVGVALKARGFGPGDVVGVCSENSMELPVPILGALFIGATSSPLNFNYTPRELRHSLGLTSPRVIFFSAGTQDAVIEAVSEERSPPLLVRLPDDEGDEEEGSGFLTLGQLISGHSSQGFQPYRPADPDSCIALVMCSSGTTGLPKGVQLSQTNVLAGISNPLHKRYEIHYKNTVFPGHLPMFHAFGLMLFMGAIARSFSMVVMPFFSPDTFLRIIQDYKVTSLPVVPPLMQLLAASDLVNQFDLSSLTHVTCGAAPLSRELQTAVSKRLNLKDIRQGYGLTECTLASLQVPNGIDKPGCSGCVVPGMEAKVIDPETGKLLGVNERGELCFRGVLVMKGYAGNPEATAEAIDSEGWLRTGDVAYYDKEECFYIVDRLKELIKYKGFQVPPAELEAVLLTHPGVEDAAVVGIANLEAGELPLAFVVRRDENLTERQVIDFVSRHVSAQKRLRGGVRFIDAIPKNPSGKILRRELRQLLQSKL